MKTKQNLIVAAFGLFVGVLLTQTLQPTPAQAQIPAGNKFSNLSFTTAGKGIVFFDHSTGDVWVYSGETPTKLGKLVTLGNPLQ